ncbi:hypothetical protein HPP92_007909 [Vanilla planifolia]|uniref:C2 domain-containing protein n=1 Tax=Vanilla planifolia TaxID=51239 RepID=A0A835RF39_VANPL|nr:hypothetical protein HPP92_007909 [Vanilla planifolia]
MLLHGMLYVDILEAEALPNPLGLPNSTSRFSRRKWLERRCSWMKRLASWFPKRLEDVDLTAKLYATIDLEKARVGRTRVVAGEPSNPRWYESFRIYCAHMAEYVIFTLKSENPVGATLLGRAYLPTAAILAGDTIDTFLDVCNENRRPLASGAAIRVRVRYASVEEEEEEWGGGIRTADFPGVPHTFFEQRRGCRVTLYHDAHVAGNFVPRIPLAGGEMFHPGDAGRTSSMLFRMRDT